MQVPTKQRNRARTSILIGEYPAITYIVQENAAEVKQKPKKKVPFLWHSDCITFDVHQECD